MCFAFLCKFGQINFQRPLLPCSYSVRYICLYVMHVVGDKRCNIQCKFMLRMISTSIFKHLSFIFVTEWLRYVFGTLTFILFLVCLATYSQPFPKPFPRRVRFSALSFKFQYLLFPLRSSSSCLSLRPHFLVRSTFPSKTREIYKRLLNVVREIEFGTKLIIFTSRRHCEEKCQCALFSQHDICFFVFKQNNGFGLSETQEVKLGMYIIF